MGNPTPDVELQASQNETEEIDSAQEFLKEVRTCLSYAIVCRNSFGSIATSIIRDNVENLLLKSSSDAITTIRKAEEKEKMAVRSGKTTGINHFKKLPDVVVLRIFGFLSGRDLARVQLVCRRWKKQGSTNLLWRRLSLEKFPALGSDLKLWGMYAPRISACDPKSWRKVYPLVENTARVKLSLFKSGVYFCRLNLHCVSGAQLSYELVGKVDVRRRLALDELEAFIRTEPTVFYISPYEKEDQAGLNKMKRYLERRFRAGVAHAGGNHVVFIPPCNYARAHLNYWGQNLLAVAFPTVLPVGFLQIP